MSADDIKAAASGETEPGTMSQAATTDDAINAALAKLDPKDDTHWTADGKPAMDALNALLPAPITRKRLEEVAPDFKRPSEQTPAEPFGGNGDHDGNGTVGGAAPPIDNSHVADGAQQFTEEDIAAASGFGAAPLKREGAEGAIGLGLGNGDDERDARIAALEADMAFLRKQFGWPTKDT